MAQTSFISNIKRHQLIAIQYLSQNTLYKRTVGTCSYSCMHEKKMIVWQSTVEA